MINKLRKDDYLFGALLGLGTILITAGILLIGLTIFSKGFYNDPKLFLFSFIPALLLMRWYFKIQYIKSAKSLLITIIVGFALLVILLFKLGLFYFK